MQSGPGPGFFVCLFVLCFFKCAKILLHSSVRRTMHHARGLASDLRKGKQ